MSLGLLKVERLQVVLGTILHDKMKGPVGILQSPQAGEGMIIDFFQHNTGVFFVCLFLSGGGGGEQSKWQGSVFLTAPANLKLSHHHLPRTVSVNWVSG